MKSDIFVFRALQLVGQSYAETDCIGVVRKAANIKCQGTNWLWRSIANSPKYRFLVERSTKRLQEDQFEDGLLLFRIRYDTIPKGYSDPPDCHHVGILGYIDGAWKVIQSNPSTGVYVSSFNADVWNGWGKLKMIEYTGPVAHEEPDQPIDKLEEIWFMVKTLYDAYMKGKPQD